MTNPLLDTSSLPRFDEIAPEHVLPAIRHVIADNRAELGRLLDPGTRRDVDGLVAPIEHMEHELGRIWSPVSHLQSVLGSKAWREAYKQALPLLTEYSTELSQNADLQRAYADVRGNLPGDAPAACRSAVDHALRDFHLAGVDLEEGAKNRFKAIMQELAEVQATFEHNVQDASDAWSLNVTDENELRGLPDTLLARAAEDAKAEDLDGWLLKLDFPTYDAVMKQADSRDLREALYRGWVTRGSDQGRDPKWDNSENIERILALRHEAADLVGFDNYAEYSLATKMADTPAQVLEFLRELAGHSREAAEHELAELTAFAGMPLEAWDVTYWLEKFKQDRYSISNEELRAYFPAITVKEGLFALASQLYDVELSPNDSVSAWHDDVRYYDVRQNGELLGGFYTDLYARNGKRAGAWIDECVTRQVLNGYRTLPVGYLVCNFPPADDDGVSLLTHTDVVTLFHEFGHMLHHLLTRVNFPSVSGINGVPWDAVELPSQFMENFAWNYDVLTRCSSHYETSEPLPRDLFDKLDNSRHAGAALAMLRQIELALFDFRIHTEYDPDNPVPVLQTLDEVRDEVALIRHPDTNRLPHAFSHIFGGGYAAGYYSYKWAEVLAADAYDAFEEAGTFDRDTAGRFRHEILEVGGSRDIMEAYKAFRGREPTIDALLRQNGIET
ncbi:MAG: M3 family metallopeptidase [Gammaproteobacteria bacterium]|nr:M3 family metallopeptidase [Gammaproteobacteria bacterium]NNF50557.1 M3 family metallopeptidase [Woeseiaceae bacterium]MBT8093356.1 M3 family metallopeptidase [Gammaproteobacteria bacterium]MBT8104389.1 M3 family metallopeptidase [Gammaproteobacteria bacterium]NNK24405.1 M3 family metallopeptidase [Woeseiaceae bacterium]